MPLKVFLLTLLRTRNSGVFHDCLPSFVECTRWGRWNCGSGNIGKWTNMESGDWHVCRSIPQTPFWSILCYGNTTSLPQQADTANYCRRVATLWVIMWVIIQTPLAPALQLLKVVAAPHTTHTSLRSWARVCSEGMKSSVCFCKRHILACIRVVWAILREDGLGPPVSRSEKKSESHARLS